MDVAGLNVRIMIQKSVYHYDQESCEGSPEAL